MHSREEKLEQFGRLLDIMDALRDRCPWNAAQTMSSIRHMTEEEVYELSDEIMKGNSEGICKEIGDLLYHMVFYARIAQEDGLFDIADSMEKICAKMIFRHPHVFRPDGSLVPKGEAPSAKEIADTWEIVKAKEKGGNRTVMSGIPDTMPALLKALSMQEKAQGCGFDWKNTSDILGKLHSDLSAVESGSEETDPQEMEQKIGELLFTVIYAAHLYGVNAEAALGSACSNFRRRFDYMEGEILKSGRQFSDLTLEQMDEIWFDAAAKGL